MKRIRLWAGAALLAVAGCGGGGGGANSAARLATGGNYAVQIMPGEMTRNGTVHFNQLTVAAMTVQDDNGAILTPVNPPPTAFEGERVSIRFVPATDPLPTTFVRTPPNPIVLLDFVPL